MSPVCFVHHVPGQHQWLAQGGCFFLNAAGIGQDKVAAHHKVDQRYVVERFDQLDAGQAGEFAIDRAHHIRIAVNRVNKLDVVTLSEHR